MPDQNLEALINLMIPGDSRLNLPSGSYVDLDVILQMENKWETAILLAEQFAEIVHGKLNKTLIQLTVEEFDAWVIPGDMVGM